MCRYTFPQLLVTSSSVLNFPCFFKALAVLKSVQVMEYVKMDLVFVMNLVDGEDLCVKYQDAQG